MVSIFICNFEIKRMIEVLQAVSQKQGLTFQGNKSSLASITSNLLGIHNSSDFQSIPYIPRDIPLSQAHTLVPEGFDDMVACSIDEASQALILTILTDDNRENVEITISSSMFNPSKVGCSYPSFLIELTHEREKKDYFQKDSRLILNQNELIWLTLQHRLVDFKQHNNSFSGLINSDLKAIRNFISYIPYTAYNAVSRQENTFIILGLYDFYTKSFKRVKNNSCIGTLLSNNAYFPSPVALDILLDTLPLHYTSESNGEKSKFVLKPYEEGEVYRSIGHETFKDAQLGWCTKSIFPVASNLPARTKTHVGANAYKIANFQATSPFIRDYLPNMETKTYEPKDECYIETLVVIHPMGTGNFITKKSEKSPDLTDKFLFGEIDVSPKITGTKVIVRESISNQFEQVIAEIGKPLKAKDGKILVGLDILEEPVYLEDCLEAVLTNDIPIGSIGYQKLVFNVTKRAGNARLDSNTGLKGVTKCRPNLGKIVLKDSDKTLNEDFIKEYSSFSLTEAIELKPDMVFGMNSYKAKKNGITLAAAALAVRLGTYKPKHFSGLLNELDKEEILAAAQSLPEFTYIDMFGNEVPVRIGLVYSRFTEICSVYKSYKPQSFSFEAGRWLNKLESQTIFNNIWDNYLNPERKNAVIELQKILLSGKDIFEDSLPSYSVSQIKSKKIFTESDLILRARTSSESVSKLLDPEWNKGFILNLTGVQAGHIRIPSANMLRIFCSPTEDGMYMYPQLLVLISRILNSIFLDRGYLLKKYQNQRYNLVEAYKSEVYGILYSDENASMMMVQTLSRPEVDGFAGKQSTDLLLPPQTCVIFDWKIWKQAIKNALGPDYALEELKHGFWGFHVRSPALWQDQLQPCRIWNRDDYEIYLYNTHGISLDDYLVSGFNQDLIILSGDILTASCSDNDGDHSVVFTPKGLDIQKSLREYTDTHIPLSQKQWIQEYIDGEFSSNKELIDSSTGELQALEYEIYTIPLKSKRISRNKTITGFNTFLTQAISAKRNIGIATNDSWLISAILECYQAYYIQNDRMYREDDSLELKPMRRVTKEEEKEISSYYVIALQQFVIRGVKHNSEGSSAFSCLFLDELHLPENNEKVYNLLTQDLNMPSKLVTKLIFVVNWATNMKILTAASAFLKLYNKGTLPSKEGQKALDLWEPFIQENTYFGNLIDPLYDLRKQAGKIKKENEIMLQATLEKSKKDRINDPSFDPFLDVHYG